MGMTQVAKTKTYEITKLMKNMKFTLKCRIFGIQAILDTINYHDI